MASAQNDIVRHYTSRAFGIAFTLIKHFLMATMLLLIIWTLVQIPMMDEVARERRLKDYFSGDQFSRVFLGLIIRK